MERDEKEKKSLYLFYKLIISLQWLSNYIHVARNGKWQEQGWKRRKYMACGRAFRRAFLARGGVLKNELALKGKNETEDFEEQK
jgi:hypothetical protein